MFPSFCHWLIVVGDDWKNILLIFIPFVIVHMWHYFIHRELFEVSTINQKLMKQCCKTNNVTAHTQRKFQSSTQNVTPHDNLSKHTFNHENDCLTGSTWKYLQQYSLQYFGKKPSGKVKLDMLNLQQKTIYDASKHLLYHPITPLMIVSLNMWWNYAMHLDDQD